MPWISVTLLSMKYLSQVALRRGESQNMRHSWVVTVPLADSMVLAHTSNVFHTSVRLPRMHTLRSGGVGGSRGRRSFFNLKQQPEQCVSRGNSIGINLDLPQKTRKKAES